MTQDRTTPAQPGRAELPLTVVGLDHHRTPVQVREKLALGGEAAAGLLRTLAALPGCGEAVALSTCNRVELYLGGSPDREHVVAAIAERQGITPALIDANVYWMRGSACARHLFRVAASLESLVIGEYQIVHQLKDAYESARALGLTGTLLNPLFQRALAVAAEVRNDTAIGKHKLSVASVAVDLARQIHGDLGRARLLVIGAGEIAELAVKHLLAAGVRELAIINRSQERALALAQLQAGAVPVTVWEWSDLRTALFANDIVVASTSAPNAVVAEADVRAASKSRRAPLMLIDLAVPRDIEEAAGKLEDVYLYNIDHLESVVARNKGLRSEEVDSASALIDAAAAAYVRQQGSGRPALLAEVAAWFDDMVAAEEARLAAKLGAVDRAQLRYGLERVGNKLQHQLLRFLRERAGDPAAEAAVREILGMGSPEVRKSGSPEVS